MVRLIRRLEVYIFGDGELQEYLIPTLDQCATNLGFDFRCFYIFPPRFWSYRRIDYRVEQFFYNGLLDEVKQLMDEGLTENERASRVIGYHQSMRYLKQGDFSDASFRNLLLNVMGKTRRYSKLQRTWFKTEEIYEYLPLNVPNIPPHVPTDASILSIPENVKNVMFKEIVAKYEMSHEKYWNEHRFSPNVKEKQLALQQQNFSNDDVNFVPQFLTFRNFESLSNDRVVLNSKNLRSFNL